MPAYVAQMQEEELRIKLLKYKVALQPSKHVEIWHRLCCTFMDEFDGDIRRIFNSVKRIKDYILANKKQFPYLSGTKILNYWLYVMSQYTDVQFCDREYITVAPDTHVIQASEKLGLITQEDITKTNIRDVVSLLWEKVLDGTGMLRFPEQFDNGGSGDYTAEKYENEEPEPSDEEIRKMFGF